MTARLSLGLVGFVFGTARALALVRVGLISLGAARGPAGSGFGFNLVWPRMLILLLGLTRILLARGGGLRRCLRIPPAARAYVLASFKRFGRLPPATAFSGLTSLLLDG